MPKGCGSQIAKKWLIHPIYAFLNQDEHCLESKTMILNRYQVVLVNQTNKLHSPIKRFSDSGVSDQDESGGQTAQNLRQILLIPTGAETPAMNTKFGLGIPLE